MKEERETTQEEIIEYINRVKRNFKKRRIELSEIYITTECLEKLNQIFTINSITELMSGKTILGLQIIEITSKTKFTFKEVLAIKHLSTILICSQLDIYNMRYKKPRLRKWQ